jgi:SAM-dependent methyltransferase
MSEEGRAGEARGWSWDPSLYAGSAAYYATGRFAYPDELARVLTTALDLDGSGRLLDVGCGPGSLTLLLAPYFTEAIGVDADRAMLTEAARQAAAQEIRHVRWRHLRAEELPADLPPVRVVTFAQSFHWMERERVASAVRTMLGVGGAVVHVSATTHEGIAPDVALPHPQPPRHAVAELVRHYVGPQRRAGRGVRTAIPSDREEDAAYRAAGLSGPQRLDVPGRVVERTPEEVVASVYSVSGSAPHLFGDRLAEFDAELRHLLREAAGRDGRFSEQTRPVGLDIWR